jgi:YVTN family beta-propeller protein
MTTRPRPGRVGVAGPATSRLTAAFARRRGASAHSPMVKWPLLSLGLAALLAAAPVRPPALRLHGRDARAHGVGAPRGGRRPDLRRVHDPAPPGSHRYGPARAPVRCGPRAEEPGPQDHRRTGSGGRTPPGMAGAPPQAGEACRARRARCTSHSPGPTRAPGTEMNTVRLPILTLLGLAAACAPALRSSTGTADPGAPAPITGRDRVYTADQVSNTVSVIDPSGNRLLGVIRLGNPRPDVLSPLYGGQINVHGLGFSPDGRTLNVVSTATNAVTLIDLPTNTVRGTIYVDRNPPRGLLHPRWARALGDGTGREPRDRDRSSGLESHRSHRDGEGARDGRLPARRRSGFREPLLHPRAARGQRGHVPGDPQDSRGEPRHA